MDIVKYDKIVKNNTPKEDRIKNTLLAFISGGVIGLIGQALIDFYINLFNLSSSDAGIMMIMTLIIISCLFTALGFFDKIMTIFKSGIIIPITGFAHSMMSAAMEYRSEGLITGIGANIFKLAGAVILYGVVAAYIFGLIRIIVWGS